MGEERKESKKKWRPVHEIITEMLEQGLRPDRISTLAEIYRKGAKVPLNGISALIKSLEKFKGISWGLEPNSDDVVGQAITMLKKQEKEQLLVISEEKKRKIIERRQGETVLLEDALKAVEKVVNEARKDLNSEYGGPVAVAVMGSNFRLVILEAMDGVMPVSVDLCIKKAHTAIAGQKETLEWKKAEKAGLDGRNFGDESWTCFGGGVPVRINNRIIGAVGVSGRHSHKEELLSNQEDLLEDRQKIPPQDHELAQIGARYLEELYC